MSVQTEITRLSNAKSAIKTAIGNKGVTVPSTTKLDGMATLIGQIPTGTDTSDATAAAGDILSGKTAYVGGSKVTGTIATKAAATYYPSASDQSISASQYLKGAQTIKAVKATNLTAKNIKSGVTVQIGDASDADRVMSVTGTYTGSSIEYDLNPVEVTMTSNKVIAPNGTIASGSGSGYLLSDKITVSEGETYRLTAKMNYGNYVYALYNSSNSIVDGVKAATGGIWTYLTNELITIPSGVTGLRFGSYNNIAYGLKKRLQG